ncbi:MAG: hypothetical protein HY900_27590 [Deltaproteobacteria bacterium]|nr:hypothetical protein [Deltaproteobacteria bacterium]
MAEGGSAFERIPDDVTRPAAVRSAQVLLQAELLRAGAQWEESLAVLRELASHRRSFPSAAQALIWYRSGYHPDL